MYRKSASREAFARAEFSPRFFPHEVTSVSKPYPDSQLLLERRGETRGLVDRDQFVQLNLYTTQFYDLPDALFGDPDVNWHRQQFGRKGLVAAAGLRVRDRVATVSVLQSDLCQQLYRHAALRETCKTRVETRFKYWYRFLLNAILDYCVDQKIETVRCPTGATVVAHTRRAIAGELFLRIYDAAAERYVCSSVSSGKAAYWDISVSANRDRIVRLAEARPPEPPADARPTMCIFHDIEEDVDTDISQADCAEHLTAMLAIERDAGVQATYNVLGMMLQRKRDEILASDSRHAVGFHSFDHRLADLTQLPRCRDVDLRVRGYRPPQSRVTAELSDGNLTYFNFEWFACSANSLGFSDCRLQRGIVKIPIHADDYVLSSGADYGQWERGVLEQAKVRPFFGLGLHDCYGDKWIAHYPSLLEKLARTHRFVSADEICDGTFLGELPGCDDLSDHVRTGLVPRPARWDLLHRRLMAASVRMYRGLRGSLH
jgi:hypothetical protein